MERSILRENYTPSNIEEVLNLLPGRTKSAVLGMAGRMRLTSSGVTMGVRRKPWTEDQEQLLIYWYGKIPMPDVAKKVGRGTCFVQVCAKLLGLSKPGRAYSKRKVDPQRAADMYAAGVPLKDIAAEFSASKVAVLKYVDKMGVPRRNKKPVRVFGPINKKMTRAEFSRYMSAKWQGVELKEWKGYITNETSRKRVSLKASAEWRAWRSLVFRRDRAICAMCKRSPEEHGEKLDPHHIQRKCERPDLVFEVDNGITLCRSCHMSIGGKEKKYEDRSKAHVIALKEYWREKWAA
jgi:hypothetical protein